MRKIGDLEMLTNPTVGLAAHSGQVDIRITAKADSIQQADEMIRPVEDELRRRNGELGSMASTKIHWKKRRCRPFSERLVISRA